MSSFSVPLLKYFKYDIFYSWDTNPNMKGSKIEDGSIDP
jgi:hypothetical protein